MVVLRVFDCLAGCLWVRFVSSSGKNRAQNLLLVKVIVTKALLCDKDLWSFLPHRCDSLCYGFQNHSGR